MTTQAHADGVARGVLCAIADDHIELAISGTAYRLHLVPTVPTDQLRSHLGKPVRGTIRAQALRIHPARGGGRFIEPVWGAPRILAGAVKTSSQQEGSVLVDVGVPMWVRLREESEIQGLSDGTLVNFYVESGASFTPEEP